MSKTIRITIDKEISIDPTDDLGNIDGGNLINFELNQSGISNFIKWLNINKISHFKLEAEKAPKEKLAIIKKQLEFENIKIL